MPEKCTFSRKSYFVLPENRTFQKNVPFPENRTFFQKIVLVFHFSRKMYLFSENRTIALHPLSYNGFRRFGFQKFVLIFTFLENYLHKYIQRIYILLIFVSETKQQQQIKKTNDMKTTKFNPYKFTRKENYNLQCELYEKYLSEKNAEKRAEYKLMMDKLAKVMVYKLFKV